MIFFKFENFIRKHRLATRNVSTARRGSGFAQLNSFFSLFIKYFFSSAVYINRVLLKVTNCKK